MAAKAAKGGKGGKAGNGGNSGKGGKAGEGGKCGDEKGEDAKGDGPLRGGATNFFLDDGKPVCGFAPIGGYCLVHEHGERCLLHEGAVVTSGSKYLLRTDAVYRRINERQPAGGLKRGGFAPPSKTTTTTQQQQQQQVGAGGSKHGGKGKKVAKQKRH